MGPWRAGKDLRLTRVSSGGGYSAAVVPRCLLPISRGTEISNPVPSSSESANHRFRDGGGHHRQDGVATECGMARRSPSVSWRCSRRAHTKAVINVARPIYPRPKPASTCEKRLSLTWRDADYPVDIWRYTSRPFLYSRECLDVGMLQAERNRGNRLVSIHFGR